MDRVSLPTVTLCAASSVNVAATVAAIRSTLSQVDVGRCLLFTDRTEQVADPAIIPIKIPRLKSSSDYSRFMLKSLPSFVQTDHCLVVQWDGFAIDAGQWDDSFLNYDYVGAPWPQFHDSWNVGNGGFSLRSRKLLEACMDPAFVAEHPEDVAICRRNRALLEAKYCLAFAPHEVARRFSVERSEAVGQCFGFHGAFHLIRVLGPDRFWEIYESLDRRESMFTDFATLFSQLGNGPKRWSRRYQMGRDLVGQLMKRSR